jgi:hypothetical protein
MFTMIGKASKSKILVYQLITMYYPGFTGKERREG